MTNCISKLVVLKYEQTIKNGDVNYGQKIIGLYNGQNT